MAEAGVLGLFADGHRAAAAVRSLKAQGEPVAASMPALVPEVVEALDRPLSGIAAATLIAAVTGAASGFALCIWTSLKWKLLTGGKPFASIPPFVIVAFEVTVLFGAVITLIAGALLGWRGRRKERIPYDVRFSADRIGLWVRGGGDRAERLLRDAGADEVRRV